MTLTTPQKLFIFITGSLLLSVGGYFGSRYYVAPFLMRKKSTKEANENRVVVIEKV